MTAFREVYKEEFDKIIKELIDFRYHVKKKTLRVRSLDENERVKSIIELFEKYSTIKGVIGDTTIYVMPIYYGINYIFHYEYEVLIASLILKRDKSGYIVKENHMDSDLYQSSIITGVEKPIEKLFGGFVKLLGKTISDKHPIATKLAEIAGCWRGIESISLLYRLYGDEILNDDTIPGIHSVCHDKATFFANDKVIVIPYIDLWVVRDKRSGKIFRYHIFKSIFYEISSKEKIFYDALFEAHRELLKPNVGSKTSSGYKTVINGKEVSLIVLIEHPSNIDDIFAIACDLESGRDKCETYSFFRGKIYHDITETLSKYVLQTEKTGEKAREWIVKKFIKEHEWEILPA